MKISNVILATVSASLLPHVSSPTSADIMQTVNFNGHSYHQIGHPQPGGFQPMTWFDAEEEARSLGGHLVTINDQEENELIFTTFGISWIGFTDSQVEGEWRWTSGEGGIWQDPDNFLMPIQTSYVNWRGGEPNNQFNEDFGIIEPSGTWNDGHPNTFLFFGIAEVVPEPNSLMILSFCGVALLRRLQRIRK